MLNQHHTANARRRSEAQIRTYKSDSAPVDGEVGDQWFDIATSTMKKCTVASPQTWVSMEGAGGGGGEANTASNVGTGAGWFKDKVLVDLRFKSVKAGSARLTIVNNVDDLTLDIVASLPPDGAASGDLGGTYPSPTVTQARGLRETFGPTTLVVGAVADGEFLKRVGATVVGAVPTAVAADPSYSPGSFTIATETARLFMNHLKLTGSQRATIAGTGRLRLSN